MATRTVTISLVEQTPRARRLVFIPDLTSADADLVLNKSYSVTTDANGNGSIDLPVKSTGSIRYRYEIPSISGLSRGSFSLAAGASIELDDLIAAGGVASDSLQDYVDARAVRYDAGQGLSGAQQLQARNNIGAGTPGANGFTHSQSSPATEWIVNHNLGFKPVVEVIDTGGIPGLADIVHISINQLRIYFAAPLAGEARCI